MSGISESLRKYLESNGCDVHSVNQLRCLKLAHNNVDTKELSEQARVKDSENPAAKSFNWINHNRQSRLEHAHNNVKQTQQDLLNYYCSTLTINELLLPSDILRGYHEFVKQNPQYKDYVNVLSFHNTVSLGLMLRRIPCMTKKFKSVNNNKSMYYWRVK